MKRSDARAFSEMDARASADSIQEHDGTAAPALSVVARRQHLKGINSRMDYRSPTHAQQGKTEQRKKINKLFFVCFVCLFF